MAWAAGALQTAVFSGIPLAQRWRSRPSRWIRRSRPRRLRPVRPPVPSCLVSCSPGGQRCPLWGRVGFECSRLQRGHGGRAVVLGQEGSLRRLTTPAKLGYSLQSPLITAEITEQMPPPGKPLTRLWCLCVAVGSAGSAAGVQEALPSGPSRAGTLLRVMIATPLCARRLQICPPLGGRAQCLQRFAERGGWQGYCSGAGG